MEALAYSFLMCDNVVLTHTRQYFWRIKENILKTLD